MPPTKRARGGGGGGSKGWLPVWRDPSKLPRRAEGDGTPLPDEILLGIFAGFPEIANLVRCVATCRRWRRLVSGEAAFISRQRPGTGDNKFQPPLALGFFHQHDAAAPRFIPKASAASRRFPGLQSPSSSPLLDSSSCIVASRNGLVVVDLCRGGGGCGKHVRALNLCVCNPMTGEAHALPPLAGKDRLGHYACTVLTADDYHDGIDPPQSPSSYRLLLLYSRCGFTAFRCYSDDSGGWSPEAKVTGVLDICPRANWIGSTTGPLK
ncbi:unnamed protein product [Urochloa decumbens]|uniref:F-box domain-containing protein n=1 Tax=Urochloa decumbens TaxID=240449 RepID=A0ABC9C1T6_9POAL